MKSTVQVKSSIQICIICTLLVAAFFTGSLAIQHSTAHACGISQVPGSENTIALTQIETTFNYWLEYNSCTSVNYAEADISLGNWDGSLWVVSVVRLSGPDGGQVTESTACTGGNTCVSPSIYSPNNKAYVELKVVNYPPNSNLIGTGSAF